LLEQLVPGRGRLDLGLLEVLLVAHERVEAGVVGQAAELAVGQGHVVDVDVVHAGLDLLDARQVVDIADPARPMPADQMILLRVHHVDVLPGDQFGLGNRVVLARHQLVFDVLVIELLEDVDVLGNDLGVVLPPDEMQRFGRRRRSLAHQARGGQRRGCRDASLQDCATAQQVLLHLLLLVPRVALHHAPSPWFVRRLRDPPARPRRFDPLPAGPQ
jgi:hypothetical protein